MLELGSELKLLWSLVLFFPNRTPINLALLDITLSSEIVLPGFSFNSLGTFVILGLN